MRTFTTVVRVPNEVSATTNDKTRLHLELYCQMAKAFKEIAREAGIEDMRELFPKATITVMGPWARKIKVDLS